MSLHIGIDLKVGATLEFSTLPRELLRIEGKILVTSRSRIYALKGGHPLSTAKRTATRANSPDTPGLLTRPNLFHFDAYMKGFCQHADEFTEIYTPIGYIVEDGFAPIALVLNVAYLHLQTQRLGYLTRLNHGAMLPALRLLAPIEVTLGS